jgi:hypothetical protein
MNPGIQSCHQLLEETLDSGGHPLTTSPNTLRDIVLPPSLLSKLLSVAGANVNTAFNSPGVVGPGPFMSPIPWRKAGLRYNRNEIYFDTIEDLKAIVDKYAFFTQPELTKVNRYHITGMARRFQVMCGAKWK